MIGFVIPMFCIESIVNRMHAQSRSSDFELEQIGMTQNRARLDQEWTSTGSGSGLELDNLTAAGGHRHFTATYGTAYDEEEKV